MSTPLIHSLPGRWQITDDYTPNEFNKLVVKLQGLDNFTTPLFFKFGTQGGKEFVDKLKSWKVDRIVTAHTALVLEDGQQVAEKGYSWYA